MADEENKEHEDNEEEERVKEGQHFTLEVNDGFLSNITKKER